MLEKTRKELNNKLTWGGLHIPIMLGIVQSRLRFGLVSLVEVTQGRKLVATHLVSSLCVRLPAGKMIYPDVVGAMWLGALVLVLWTSS